MKAFVTGGTGFIGKQVVAQLVARGDTVLALARSEASAQALTAIGAQPVRGDLFDLDVLRAAMRGCDVVFHIAAYYKLGAADETQIEAVNVQGTRNVLSIACEVGTPKIVYTSSVAVNGDTHGALVDETYFQGGPFLTPYDRTKWRAHYEVAVPLIAQGAPIVIVMPGAVYGPHDHSLVGEMLRLAYSGDLPVLPGPETMLSFVYVDDVATGLLWAADKGRVGESYHLTGPALTLQEFLTLWAEVSGRRAPLFTIPAGIVRPLGAVVGLVERVIPFPMLFSRDAASILGATYLARADKARAELGWSARTVREGLRATLAAQEDVAPVTPAQQRQRQIMWLSLASGVLLGVIWMFTHLTRRRHTS